jgi:hypothetical protein
MGHASISTTMRYNSSRSARQTGRRGSAGVASASVSSSDTRSDHERSVNYRKLGYGREAALRNELHEIHT